MQNTVASLSGADVWVALEQYMGGGVWDMLVKMPVCFSEEVRLVTEAKYTGAVRVAYRSDRDNKIGVSAVRYITYDNVQSSYVTLSCNSECGTRGDYRFGFNGMHKDNEVKGTGNSYDTEYRVYDSRLCRWSSVDPKTKILPSESPYNAMGNSPMWRIDPKGDIAPIVVWTLKKMGEAAIGVMTDVGIQLVAEKYFGNNGEGHATWSAAWNALNIDWWQAISSGGENLVKNKHLSAALSAGSDMLHYYLSNDDATWEGAMMRGGTAALSAYIGGGISKFIGKYGAGPLARGLQKSLGYSASMLRKAGLELFSDGIKRTSSEGLSNLQRHFKKHVLDNKSYNFRTEADLNNYAIGFFERSGSNIREFTDAYGYIHRIYMNTNEFGVMAPDGLINTVFKVQPKPNSTFSNTMEYLE